MTTKDFKKIILDKLKDILKPRHFKKTGNSFSVLTDDLGYFINLQSSINSTSEILKVTVNIRISSKVIYRLEDVSVPEHFRWHYTERIGQFLNDRQDKWWEIKNNEEAIKTAEEISVMINDKILPLFNQLKTTSDLVNLWKQGTNMGLSLNKAQEYLLLLGIQ